MENNHNNLSASYNKVSKFKRQAILAMLANKKNGNILDIGCGPGVLGEIIKKETGAKVYGLDVSAIFIESAQKKLDKAFNISAADDYDNWPEEIKTARFDYVLITDVLEHLACPDKLLTNIKKIMNENTEAIITVPNILFWKNRLKILFGQFNYTTEGLMDKTHLHFFTWRSLKKLLHESGFSIIKTIHHYPTRGTGLLGPFFPGFFSYKFIVKFKKYEK